MTSAAEAPKPSEPIGFEEHDHGSCISGGIAAAEAQCASAGLRFTPVRRKTLEILLQEHRALGAYEMLDRLRDAGFGSQPPVAYRALEFLVANGFAHKIERLNAFVACVHPGANHSPAFMICRLCASVAEAQSAPTRGALGEAARATGFKIEQTVIEAEGICPVCVEGVSLSVEPGEIVTIVGPNGSGKTTLLKLLVGAEQSQAGRITRQSGLRIGYVPQKLHIDPTLPITVERFLRLPGGTPRAACAAALEKAGVPGLSSRQMSALSGGQFQRVLLARALINEPDLLLLDEATQGLDQPGSAAFYLQIEDVRKKTGCAILMISHELHVVMAASDRVICLNGHVCCEGAPGGALALYRHEHDHTHDENCAHDHTPHDEKTEAAQ